MFSHLIPVQGRLSRISTLSLVLLAGLFPAHLHAQFYPDKDLVPNAGEKNAEWRVASGYTLVEDSQGYNTPVGLALVPGGAKKPTDPLFLVTELRGDIKARLKNGTVIKVGSDPRIAQPRKELPEFNGETGQTGLCFTKDGTRMYTTGVYLEGWGTINKMAVWEQGSEGWKNPQKIRDFTEIFEKDTTGLAHQIGHCVIDEENHLWVGVGDGQKFRTSHLLESSNGKILRMNLDLTPAKGNPFQGKGVVPYIYAMGVRNSFAIAKIPGGHLYAADNGPEMDRLLMVEKGVDYPWDNTNISMTFNNLLTFPHPIGPSGMVYVPENHPLKDLRGHLIVAGAHITSLLAIPVKEGKGISGEPRWLVRPTNYYKDRKQDFTGVTLADDGLYITHIRMHMEGGILPSPVLKLVPGEKTTSEMEYTGEQLIEIAGCRSCHTIAGVGGNVGPNLDSLKGRLSERLENDDYLKHLQELQSNDREPNHDRWVKVRADLIAKKGSLEDRMGQWIVSKVSFPGFENSATGMAQLELKPGEPEKIKDFLLFSGSKEDRLGDLAGWDYVIMKQFEQNPRIPLFLTALGGLLVGLFWKRIFFFIRKKKD